MRCCCIAELSTCLCAALHTQAAGEARLLLALQPHVNVGTLLQVWGMEGVWKVLASEGAIVRGGLMGCSRLQHK